MASIVLVLKLTQDHNLHFGNMVIHTYFIGSSPRGFSESMLTAFVKDCLPAILPSLTSIINATFEFDTFPLAWKTAEVTPIPKVGDHNIPNNTRPISLLPVLSKVCERVAHDQLKLTAVVLLDLSKAFDSIDHRILLAKLQDCGASRSATEWFGSYLSSRYQVVRINTTLSTKLPISSGIPQGSILGPLLFNIYVNDLPSVPENCSSQCYVDDTKLLVSFQLHDQHEAIAKMNEDLLSIRNWCFNNQLLLNPDKTKLVIFGSRQMTAKVTDFRLFLLGKEPLPLPLSTSSLDNGSMMTLKRWFLSFILFLFYLFCHTE